MPRKKVPTLGDELPNSKRRKQKMPFGKKLTNLLGEEKTIEIARSQFDAAVLTYLSAIKVVNYDADDVFSLEYFPGEKSDKTVRLKIMKRKEV